MTSLTPNLTFTQFSSQDAFPPERVDMLAYWEGHEYMVWHRWDHRGLANAEKRFESDKKRHEKFVNSSWPVALNTGTLIPESESVIGLILQRHERVIWWYGFIC